MLFVLLHDFRRVFMSSGFVMVRPSTPFNLVNQGTIGLVRGGTPLTTNLSNTLWDVSFLESAYYVLIYFNICLRRLFHFTNSKRIDVLSLLLIHGFRRALILTFIINCACSLFTDLASTAFFVRVFSQVFQFKMLTTSFLSLIEISYLISYVPANLH